VARWFLDAGDNSDLHKNRKVLLNDPFTLFLEYCMQIHSVVFALSRQINKPKVKKYAKTINLICAGNKIFITYQTWWGFNPTPLRTPLISPNVCQHV